MHLSIRLAAPANGAPHYDERENGRTHQRYVEGICDVVDEAELLARKVVRVRDGSAGGQYRPDSNCNLSHVFSCICSRRREVYLFRLGAVKKKVANLPTI